MSKETVVLTMFATELDALMARDVLKDEGVAAFVLKDDAGGVNPRLQRTNGVRLMVDAADTERAHRILRTLTSNWKS